MDRHFLLLPDDHIVGQADELADDVVAGVRPIVEVHLDMLDPGVEEVSLIVAANNVSLMDSAIQSVGS